MGAIELQVFVSLVVILGAAFVALICDFLKGNNEQLRESNIELKVRQDERDRREMLVQEVQRRTIEVVTQVQRAVGQRPAAQGQAAPAVAPKANAEPVRVQPVSPVKDARTLFEQAELARQGRGRRERRNGGAAAPVEPPAVSGEPQSPAAWAQEVYLRRFPQAESRRAAQAAAPEPVKPAAPPVTQQEDIRTVLERTKAKPEARVEPVKQEPVAVVPERDPEPVVAAGPAAAEAVAEPVASIERQPEMAGKTEIAVEPVRWQSSVHGSSGPVAQSLESGLPATRVEVKDAAPAQAGRVEMAQAPLESAEAGIRAEARHLETAGEGNIPRSGLTAEEPQIGQELPSVEPAGVEAEAAPAEPAPMAVRIRVLREEELAVESAPAEAMAEDAAEEPAAESVGPAVEAAEIPEGEPDVLPALEPAEFGWPEVPAAEVAEAVEQQPWLEMELEPESWIEPAEGKIAAQTFEEWLEPVEDAAPAEAEVLAEAETQVEELEVEPELAPAVRSNVVEMPAGAAPRAQEGAPREAGELVVPGGYHEPQALARLLEEEAPFRGLAMVVSLVDYVRLLADQGKPAMEQLMGSVSRLVVSMTREQDFACRIGEDEFVLLFVKESGAGAKGRIQAVSERLWDFQLRSLGAVSVILSWGAAEAEGEPLAHAVERAREQMIETRRSRRSLASGTGRFRRVAND